MQHSRGVLSSKPGHIEALCAKRESLKEQIREARKRPATSGDLLRRLKTENLRLKDEIEKKTHRA